jgi:hypothetical protein
MMGGFLFFRYLQTDKFWRPKQYAVIAGLMVSSF